MCVCEHQYLSVGRLPPLSFAAACRSALCVRPAAGCGRRPGLGAAPAARNTASSGRHAGSDREEIITWSNLFFLLTLSHVAIVKPLDKQLLEKKC